MLAEVAVSFLTGSLALLSNAAHMFTDATALTVSLIDSGCSPPIDRGCYSPPGMPSVISRSAILEIFSS